MRYPCERVSFRCTRPVELPRMHLALAFAISLAFLVAANSAQAYTPQSAEVRSMVKKAVRYLSEDHLYSEPYRALAAMAVYKAGEPISHPLVATAIQECVDVCKSESSINQVLNDVYELSVVGIFLCEIDPKKHEKEIARVIKVLEKRQKPFGGWGYMKPLTNWEYGDTSMTQYAVLCSWIARSSGAARISGSALNKVAFWLIRTQDVSGSWGYQGRDPGESASFKRLRQSEVRPSLGVAGLGSLYICSGMLGLTPDLDIATAEEDPSLPKAFKPVPVNSVGNSSPFRDAVGADFSELLMKRAIRDGNRWYKNNPNIPADHTMYYLYTLERYQSFKEIAENRNPKEPGWYNNGVRFLRKTQKKKGEWDTPNGEGKIADTAFGILFLVRSTKKTIQKAVESFDGLLVAGRGLPKNAGDVRMKSGKVVSTPFQGTADSLLEILGDTSHPDFDSVAQLDAIKLSRNPKLRAQQQKRMQRLVNAESFQARLVAVKTLAKLRDLDNVPTLIYALSDPDRRVVIEARDALRFTGRKFRGFGLPDSPSEAEINAAIESWKKWYREIRPDAVFVGS